MSVFQKLAQFFSGLWKNDLEPWLIDFGHTVDHDLVTTLIPFAGEAFAEVGGIAADPSMSIEQKADAAALKMKLLVSKALNAGIAVTEHDAGAAFSSVASSIAKGKEAANQTVVAQVASVPAPAPQAQ